MTRPRAATILPMLRPHHWRVLELLRAEPLLATRHVEALVFTSGTPLARARTCRRILRELTDWGLVHRDRQPPGRAGGGSDPACFAFTGAGDRVLGLRDGNSPRRYRRPADRGQGFRAHLLAVADLQVELRMGCRVRGVVLRWQGEPDCWLRFSGRSGIEVLKPDAYVELDLGSETRLTWIELDRGTQSLPVTIAAKVRRYCRAARSLAAGKEPVPRVAFLVAEPRRRDRIATLLPQWAEAEGLTATTSGRLFTVCDSAEFVAEWATPSQPATAGGEAPRG